MVAPVAKQRRLIVDKFMHRAAESSVAPLIEHDERTGDIEVSVDDVLDRLSDLKIGHVSRVIVLINREHTVMVRLGMMQDLEIFGVLGNEDQSVLLCECKVVGIVAAYHPDITWCHHDMVERRTSQNRQ